MTRKLTAMLALLTLLLFTAASAMALTASMYIEKIDINSHAFRKRYKTTAPLSELSEKNYLSFVFNLQNKSRGNESVNARAEITTPEGITYTQEWGSVTIKRGTNQRLFFTALGMDVLLYPGTYTLKFYDDSKLLMTQELSFIGERPVLSWLTQSASTQL